MDNRGFRGFIWIQRATRWGVLVGVAVGVVAATGLTAGYAGTGEVLWGAGDTTTLVSAESPNRPVVEKAAAGTSGDGAVAEKVGEGRGGIGGQNGRRPNGRDVTGPNTDNVKTATAFCPAGKRVYGGGFRVVGGLGRVMVLAARPDPGGRPGEDKFTVLATERFPDGLPANQAWSLEAHAICLPALPGYQLVAAEDRADGPRDEVRVSCPAGKRVLGLGATVEDNIAFGLATVVPDRTGQSVTMTATDDTTNGTSEDGADMSVRAICATPPPGYQVVAGARTSFLIANQVASAACPAGKELFGAGFDKRDEAGHAYPSTLVPQEQGRSSSNPGVEFIANQAPLSVRVSSQAFVICGG
jgi:hypothetical protein